MQLHNNFLPSISPDTLPPSGAPIPHAGWYTPALAAVTGSACTRVPQETVMKPAKMAAETIAQALDNAHAALMLENKTKGLRAAQREKLLRKQDAVFARQRADSNARKAHDRKLATVTAEIHFHEETLGDMRESLLSARNAAQDLRRPLHVRQRAEQAFTDMKARTDLVFLSLTEARAELGRLLTR